MNDRDKAKSSNLSSQIGINQGAGNTKNTALYEERAKSIENEIEGQKNLVQLYKSKQATFEYGSTKYMEFQKKIEDATNNELNLEKDLQKNREDMYQEMIDNVSDEIDVLKAEADLINHSEIEDNIQKQIGKTVEEYDLMIEKELNLTKKAELRAQKQKAIRDLLKEQLANIKEQMDLENSLTQTVSDVAKAQEDLRVAKGKDSYNTAYDSLLAEADAQEKIAKETFEDAERYLEKLNDAYKNGIKDDEGNYTLDENGDRIKLSDDEYKAQLADYWKMIEAGYKAETTSAENRYKAWETLYLKPKQDAQKQLADDADELEDRNKLKETKGIMLAIEDYQVLIANSKQQVTMLEE